MHAGVKTRRNQRHHACNALLRELLGHMHAADVSAGVRALLLTMALRCVHRSAAKLALCMTAAHSPA